MPDSDGGEQASTALVIAGSIPRISRSRSESVGPPTSALSTEPRNLARLRPLRPAATTLVCRHLESEVAQ